MGGKKFGRYGIIGLLLSATTGVALWASGARAVDGRPLLRSGLPKTFAWATMTASGWLPFPEDTNSIGSPLATRIFVNDESEPIRDERRLERLFQEERAAFIPEGSQIQVQRDDDQREVWEYPIGTQVAHVIWFKTQGRARLFELRLVRKVSAEAWAFGVYTPPMGSPYSGELELKEYSGLDDRTYSLDFIGLGRTRLALKGIQLESCQVCHFMHSTSNYQYADVEQAGPCGFGPGNRKVRAAWGALYRSARGYDPFRE